MGPLSSCKHFGRASKPQQGSLRHRGAGRRGCEHAGRPGAARQGHELNELAIWEVPTGGSFFAIIGRRFNGNLSSHEYGWLSKRNPQMTGGALW